MSESSDETVRLWGAMTGAALHTLEGHSGEVTSRLLARRQAGRVRVRDAMTSTLDVEVDVLERDV